MATNTLLVSWLNLYFRSTTHHFWEGKTGIIYQRLIGRGEKKKTKRGIRIINKIEIDLPFPPELIIFMLKQIEPQFSTKMKPILKTFIKQLERDNAKQARKR